MNMSRDVNVKQENDCHKWHLPDLNEAGSGLSDKLSTADLDSLQQQAYQEGFDRGHREGLDAASQVMAEKADYLDQLMRALSQPLEDLDQSVEQELLELVFTIVRQLVGADSSKNPTQIMTIVHEAIAMLPSASRNVQLHVHPHDAQLVQDSLSPAEGESSWKLIEDASIGRGGCRVTTDTTQVDATMDARLNNIIAALAGGVSEEEITE